MNLKKQAQDKNFSHIIGEFLHAPVLNANSVKFHINRGFRFIDEVPHDDSHKLLWGVYLKELGATSARLEKLA